METVLEGTNLKERAFWLIKLRWMAIALLISATFVAANVFTVNLPQPTLYFIALCISLYNAILFLTLHRIIKFGPEQKDAAINNIIILQVSADLLILTAILYFSGGIENPFLLYFVFHMIIASTLLSRTLSYFQATLAVVLFGFMMILEYLDVIRHYPLEGFIDHNLYQNGKFVFSVFFVFSTTLYLVVYMTTTIVAQLRKQQQDYRKANSLLQQQDRVKNEYILRVTHDIKGHLAAIKSCLDIVAAKMTGPLNEKQADLIDRADNRAQSCITFISALLKLTRMRITGTIERNDFSLKNSFFNAAAAAEDRATRKSIKISYNIDPSIDRFCGNALLIEDTITNMLFNAIKYTKPYGSVTITAEDQADNILIQIADSGIGIPKNEIKKVFDEFYRASNAKKIERDGTGLGLSMAKEVIERHGGRIWVESDSNGSTFSFTLPKIPPVDIT
jgi:signal transduction histidine kinase